MSEYYQFPLFPLEDRDPERRSIEPSDKGLIQYPEGSGLIDFQTEKGGFSREDYIRQRDGEPVIPPLETLYDYTSLGDRFPHKRYDLFDGEIPLIKPRVDPLIALGRLADEGLLPRFTIEPKTQVANGDPAGEVQEAPPQTEEGTK